MNDEARVVLSDCWRVQHHLSILSRYVEVLISRDWVDFVTSAEHVIFMTLLLFLQATYV